MPSIEELLKKSAKKKFVKTDYRPYDYDLKYRAEQARKAAQEDEGNESSEKIQIDEIPAIETDNTNITENVSDKITHKLEPIKNPQLDNEAGKSSFNYTNFSFDANEIVFRKREIKNLVGVQKKIFFTVFNTCVKEGALSTISFSTRDFEEITKSSLSTVKTSLFRLFKKKLLLRLDGKRAKGGYLYIGFDKQVWDICMQIANDDRNLVE